MSLEGAVFAVKDWTQEAMKFECPTKPTVMTKEQAEFIATHGMSELMEVLAVTHEDPFAAAISCLNLADKPKHKMSDFKDDVERVAEQADGLVDLIYYVLDTAARCGINLDVMFREVYAANLRKKFPDGTYHLAGKKVIKPDGFVEADAVKCIKEMNERGSWKRKQPQSVKKKPKRRTR
jgi:predicted HAD superfamily Cof-like phosphohydrolase